MNQNRVFLVFFGLTVLIGYFSLEKSMQTSFLIGALIGLLNVIVLSFTVRRFLEKKSLVMPMGVIVFKYPILAAILYILISRQSVNLVGLLIGLGAFMPAMLLGQFFLVLKAPKKNPSLSLKIDDDAVLK